MQKGAILRKCVNTFVPHCSKESIMSTDYVQGSLWPKPWIYNASGKVFSLASSDFSFDSTGETSDVLTEALKRYRSLVFRDPMEKCKATLPKITKLTVKVEEKYSPQSLETDESYTLVIVGPTSSLNAKTVWGALRGLETFSQAVYEDETGFVRLY
ncbi:beta-hexosaminidase subunit beta-like [Porites lutea]|uniref:beta-hexosaminidase subunit beta-like n=1 Tax=Porites lutea TaxID=51062 RepID=UPI003CC51BC0